jgi:hypothetical protein
MWKSILFRFLRGFAAGALAAMAPIVITNVNSWANVGVWMNSLALAGVVGGVAGLILAIDKWVRATPDIEVTTLN